MFVSDRQDHTKRKYQQEKAGKCGIVPELTGAGEKLEAVREVCLLPAAFRKTQLYPFIVTKTKSRQCLRSCFQLCVIS